MPRIWKFEDNINTDVITPGRFNLTTDRNALAKCCFCEIRPEFAAGVKTGDIIVAGKNFGCGSSRETAPLAIKSCGISVVIAESFARIFYRNAINIGLPAIVIKDAQQLFADVEEAVIDLEKNTVWKNGTAISFEPFPDFVKEIFNAGGLIEYIDR